MGLRAPALGPSLDQCICGPIQEQLQLIIIGYICIFIKWSLYKSHRWLLPGAPDHEWLGRLQCSNMECCSGARSCHQGGLPQGRGCCQKRIVPQVRRCIHLDDQITTRPQAVGLGGLYSWLHFASPANRNRSCDPAPVCKGLWGSTSCNGATQSRLAKECQALAPGSSPYMVSVDSGFRPAHAGEPTAPNSPLPALSN